MIELAAPNGGYPLDVFWLRADVEGINAHLYGLNRTAFSYILEQIPIAKRRDAAAFGEYRTARLCLEAYDRFAQSFLFGRFENETTPERTYAL